MTLSATDDDHRSVKMTSYNTGVSFAPFRNKMVMKNFVLGTCLLGSFHDKSTVN